MKRKFSEQLIWKAQEFARAVRETSAASALIYLGAIGTIVFVVSAWLS